MKLPDGSAEGRRALSGVRQTVIGFLLILPASVLWLARDFLPTLASTRVIATDVLYTLHDGSASQIESAFAAAKLKSPVEATLAPERQRGIHRTWYLSVVADTPERARADLAAITTAFTAAFPKAERNLLVSPNKSTVPAPNTLSRSISFAVIAAVVLMLLASQLLIVIGAHRQDYGRASVLAALVMPIVSLILPEDDESEYASPLYNFAAHSDWKFVLLLIALAPISVGVVLWLTRKPTRRETGRHHRA